ncbi:hypothetical protein QAD02_016449 [Eretmocerus hayati]|uniref:Uncharacterized protein n=1 Tax=Eretmocerus hayati TaxID=131215 RepID=A0ACC2PBH9_9HYME|nr:hypothetical protein QAD02_016449 [Eretmocerus hayati]
MSSDSGATSNSPYSAAPDSDATPGSLPGTPGSREQRRHQNVGRRTAHSSQTYAASNACQQAGARWRSAWQTLRTLFDIATSSSSPRLDAAVPRPIYSSYRDINWNPEDIRRTREYRMNRAAQRYNRVRLRQVFDGSTTDSSDRSRPTVHEPRRVPGNNNRPALLFQPIPRPRTSSARARAEQRLRPGTYSPIRLYRSQLRNPSFAYRSPTDANSQVKVAARKRKSTTRKGIQDHCHLKP